MRTKKGWHIEIHLGTSLQPGETVAAQVLCGSDRKRETLNLMRVLGLKNAPAFWRKRWNILYAEKLR